MSEVGVIGATRTAMLGEEEKQHWIEVKDSRAVLADTFFSTYHDSLFDDYVAESWLPQPVPSWSRNEDWAQDAPVGGYMMPRPPLPAMIYTDFGGFHETLSPTLSTEYDPTTANSETHSYQHLSQDNAAGYQNQPTSSPPIGGMSSFQIQPTRYSEPKSYGGQFMQGQHVSTWSLTEDISVQRSHIKNRTSNPISPSLSSPSVQLDWAITGPPSQGPASSDLEFSSLVPTQSFTVSVPLPKRKAQVSKSGWTESIQKDLSDCVDVFENSPGALKTVKRRKKLDAPVRKAAREVRKAGACHQCKFRKRTCSTGTPCGSCLKNGGGLHEIKCQRESPFIGKFMHQYFQHSSTRRIVNFCIIIPEASLIDTISDTVTIDGIGHLSYPIVLPARRKPLSSFDATLKESIHQTRDPNISPPSENEDPDILILEDSDSLSLQVEQWAVEYTSMFVHAAGPKFYATTMAHILGTAYVKKGLPESALVASMLRVASLSFILRAGITSPSPSPYRTIPARIDTILYTRLALAQKDLFRQLQRLIFRSAGCLSREQLYPVGLVLFQLLRFLCISASHLANIASRFRKSAEEAAEYQHMNLRLLISVHLALFRSSNPLLLDIGEKFNGDLLGNDRELVKLAGKMRGVVLGMKEKGFPELKGSITYRKGYFEEWRMVY